jgi:hypothetical protein
MKQEHVATLNLYLAFDSHTARHLKFGMEIDYKHTYKF